MRLALIGDVHLRFDADDVRALDGAGYDAVLFAGDLAGYAHRGGLRTARAIASLRTPAIVIPGNHDGAHPQQLLAEVLRHDASIVSIPWSSRRSGRNARCGPPNEWGRAATQSIRSSPAPSGWTE